MYRCICLQCKNVTKLTCSDALLEVQVADQQPLMEAGLDSLGVVELRNQLATHFSVELASTLTFDHPTPSALASYIASRAATGSSSAPVAAPSLSSEDLESEISQVVASVMGFTVNMDEVRLNFLSKSCPSMMYPHLHRH